MGMFENLPKGFADEVQKISWEKTKKNQKKWNMKINKKNTKILKFEIIKNNKKEKIKN